MIAALGAFQAYVHKREELAVARAEWKQERNKLRVTIINDSIDADARDKQRNDSIAKLTARLGAATRTAAVAGQAFTVTLAALRASADSNTATVLDSLEAQHGRQVKSLSEAVATAQAETQVERDKIADRDAQLLKLRGDLALSITRADGFERQAHPGAIKRVLDSPVTHLVAFAAGYALGAK